jgi:hypothetical protein
LGGAKVRMVHVEELRMGVKKGHPFVSDAAFPRTSRLTDLLGDLISL